MRNGIIEELENILKDKNSSPQDRTLAVCMLEIRNKLLYLERLNKVQIALLSTIVTCLIMLALAIK